ncbi:MAG: hypothetical protein LBT59_31165 [Clostridiales bacterium]|nr:hypothetical protein [Clostridiales bacterium]
MGKRYPVPLRELGVMFSLSLTYCHTYCVFLSNKREGIDAMTDEVFDLNAFYGIMKKYCGFSLEFLASEIFGSSPSSLRRILNYERPIKSIQEDQRHIDLYAANLAKAFTAEDEKSNQSLKVNCFTFFVQGLKGTPLCNKIRIVDLNQLPSDTGKREKEYEKLASDVLDEAFSATLTTAIDKMRHIDKGKNKTEQFSDDFPKSTDLVVAEPPKSSNPQSLIDSISTLSKDELEA